MGQLPPEKSREQENLQVFEWVQQCPLLQMHIICCCIVLSRMSHVPACLCYICFRLHTHFLFPAQRPFHTHFLVIFLCCRMSDSFEGVVV